MTSESIPARAVLVCLLAVVSLSARSSAGADMDEKARGKALLAEGLTLMDDGHAQEALAKFEAAYRIVPSPKVLFNMGLAHQALGNAVAALECFEGFLGELPDAPEDARAYAERQIELLRADVSFVEISANVPHGEARIDERPAGLLPLKRALVVQPGAHTVSIVSKGQEVFRQQIETVAGKRMRVFAVTPAPSVRSGRSWQRTAAWTAAGVSAVALVGGIVGHVRYDGKSSDYRDILGRNACNPGAPERGACESLRSEASSARTLAWIGYSVSALSAGAALALWLLERRADRPVRTAHLTTTCSWSVGLTGISCTGHF